MTDDEAIDLIEGYEDWRKKRASSEPDLSARAYLEERQAGRRLERIESLETTVRSAAGYTSKIVEGYADVVPLHLVQTVHDVLTREP
ncbi:hypothetical protein [Leifsonia aquatica]|uniref:hypothetical protein n=1 Tax=Leifsonia aquatica TaxID=144185 RepID=UPI000468204A|nr:hypothetical protein [Leifsonia aquatica]